MTARRLRIADFSFRKAAILATLRLALTSGSAAVRQARPKQEEKQTGEATCDEAA
jgi:hypothetical protein